LPIATSSSVGTTTTTTTTTTVAAPAPPGEGPTGPTGPDLPPAPDAPLSADWASVAAGASPAVMRVDALGVGSGTGFQVDRKGHVVTNRHVADGATKFRVRTTGGRTLPAKLVGKSARHDIAVLRVKGLKAKPLGLDGKVVAVATALTEEKQNMNYGVLGANARDLVRRLVD
jgi:S1-C subfamily serine protease